jgi:hypothetical protein
LTQKIRLAAEAIIHHLKGLGFSIPGLSGVTLMWNQKPGGGHAAVAQSLHTDGTFSFIIPLKKPMKILVAPGSHHWVNVVSACQHVWLTRYTHLSAWGTQAGVPSAAPYLKMPTEPGSIEVQISTKDS